MYGPFVFSFYIVFTRRYSGLTHNFVFVFGVDLDEYTNTINKFLRACAPGATLSPYNQFENYLHYVSRH